MTKRRIFGAAAALVIAGLLVIAAWPVALGFVAKGSLSEAREKKRRAEKAFRIKTEDLVTQLSVAELEQLERVTDPLGAVPDVPFGHLHPAWKKFRDELSPNDELWSFATTWAADWGGQQRTTGYVAINNGRIGTAFITLRRMLDEKDIVQ